MSDSSADALLKKADRKMTTTLMRWRPDLEAASTLYEEAGPSSPQMDASSESGFYGLGLTGYRVRFRAWCVGFRA